MRIYLMGFMASGKSTLGKQVAKKLNAGFIDLDDYIETQIGQSIASYFSEKGEAEFRNLESEVLRNLSTSENQVIALGGGTPCFSDNLTYINSTGISVYLKKSVDELAQRLSAGRDKRPLLKNVSPDNLIPMIEEILGTREEYYSQAGMIYTGSSASQLTTLIKHKGRI